MTVPTTAPATWHGVLLRVDGLGVLLCGDSGSGKSELALELVSRGHRLVADDCVELEVAADGSLVGRSPHGLGRFLEVRDLGILDIQRLYGEQAVLAEQRLDLIIRLERDAAPAADRLHGRRESITVCGIPLPLLCLGRARERSLAVLVECAVRTELARRDGYDAAQELANRLRQRMDRSP
ncbi:MAG TPA: hypothetical protein VNN09_15665 [Candidatus Competibacteraceae bacterium]|nr:hypothetical protein [Candidatus Competibacteraceae bacterium]